MSCQRLGPSLFRNGAFGSWRYLHMQVSLQSKAGRALLSPCPLVPVSYEASTQSADLLFAAPLLPIIWHMAGRWGRRSRHWRGLAEQIAHQLNLGKIGVCTTYLSRPIYLDVRASIIKRLRDCVVGMREFPPFRL